MGDDHHVEGVKLGACLCEEVESGVVFRFVAVEVDLVVFSEGPQVCAELFMGCLICWVALVEPVDFGLCLDDGDLAEVDLVDGREVFHEPCGCEALHCEVESEEGEEVGGVQEYLGFIWFRFGQLGSS